MTAQPMPSTIVEGALEIELGDEWGFVKWDDCRAYRHGIHKLGGCKAIDVLAFSEIRGELLMIEIKDFRRHRIENKGRIKDRELFVEVGHKARDTIAGICGAARRSGDATLTRLAAQLTTQTPLTVVLWLEEDLHAGDVPLVHGERQGTRSSMMTQQLKKSLRWLTTRAMVCSLQGSRLEGRGIRVRARPAALAE
jgi:hypothetical protein